MGLETEIMIGVVIFLIISGGVYFFFIREGNEEPRMPVAEDNDTIIEENPLVNDTEKNETNTTIATIEELHWAHMPITYRFVEDSDACEGMPIEKMLEAFREISEATDGAVNFSEPEADEAADIDLYCVNKPELLAGAEDKKKCKTVRLNPNSAQFSGHEVLDEDEYLLSSRLISKNETESEYEVCYVEHNLLPIDWELLGEAVVTKSGNVITHGKKTVYSFNSRYPYCLNFPAKEVHDVMHLLGFAHSEMPTFYEDYGWASKDVKYFRNIMFPYTYCAFQTEINSQYSECLKYVYSRGVVGDGCENVKFVA